MKRTRIIDESWYQLPQTLPTRICAGGIVAREEHGTIWLAFVRERATPFLFLPKGGQKQGESLLDTAGREIYEETGIMHIQNVCELGVRRRLGLKRNERKIIHYYLFTTVQKDAQPVDKMHEYSLWWFPLEALPPFFWPEQQKLVESSLQKIRDAF